jgi:hypothetical protein
MEEKSFVTFSASCAKTIRRALKESILVLENFLSYSDEFTDRDVLVIKKLLTQRKLTLKNLNLALENDCGAIVFTESHDCLAPTCGQ